MMQRLDKALVERGMVESRSQAESWIRLGRVKVQGKQVTKAGAMVGPDMDITLDAPERYVSRAGLKLASVAQEFGLDFTDKIVLDVGSSTGGFTDYALQHGAQKVIAVDVGTEQLHPSLRGNPRIELHEKTDIREVVYRPVPTTVSGTASHRVPVEHPSAGTRAADVPDTVSARTSSSLELHVHPDIVVIDVSFVSLRQILPSVAAVSDGKTQIVAMVKPQFEAARQQLTRGGIVKNDRMRREILRDFELWSREYFVIRAKADSAVAGAHGNRERFYVLSVSAK